MNADNDPHLAPSRLDAYLELIEAERDCRPAEAMLADEIKRAKAFLDDIVHLVEHDMPRLDFLPSHRNRVRRAKEFLDGTR